MDYMKSLLDEVKDDDVLVERLSPPSYISVFLPKENDIILIYKEVKKSKINLVYGSLCESLAEIEDEEITGQPLEAPYNPVDDTLNISGTILDSEIPSEKEMHAPVDSFNARNYLKLCNEIIKPPLPVWILCDGSDPRKIILLSSEKQNGWVRRSWACDDGTEKDAPSIDKLCLLHNSISRMPQQLIRCNVIQTCYINRIMSLDQPELHYSSTILELHWNKMCITPPLDGATESTIITNCGIGRGSGGLAFMWKQLLLLHEYFNNIIKMSKSTNQTGVELPSAEAVLEFLGKKDQPKGSRSSISARMCKLVHEPVRGHRAPVENNSNLIQLVEQFYQPNRPGLDLTDKLWYLFIECSSYQELTSCFRDLFSEIKKNSNTLFISSNNISRLAKILIGEGGANILDPFESLLEIGIEKLKNEVLLVFSKAQIATLNNLNIPKLPKFSEAGSEEWVVIVEKWLVWLTRIHCVLELLCCIQGALGLNKNSLLPITQFVLNKFTGNDSEITGVQYVIDNPIQEIKTSLPTKLVHNHITNQFAHWVLTLNSETDVRKVSSVFYRGLHSPFPHSVSLDETILDDVNTTTGLCDSPVYHNAHLHSVADKFS